MKNWLTKILPLVFALAGLAISPLTYWCAYVQQNCYGTWIHQIARTFTQPLHFFSIPTIAIAVIVIFIPYAIFKSWLKFAAWSLPLAFIFVALTPVSATHAGIDFFPYYRVNAAHDAGVAFLVLSLVFIGWKLYRRRQSVQNPSHK